MSETGTFKSHSWITVGNSPSIQLTAVSHLGISLRGLAAGAMSKHYAVDRGLAVSSTPLRSDATPYAAHVRASRYTSWWTMTDRRVGIPYKSLQLSVLGAGLFQDWDVRVSVLP